MEKIVWCCKFSTINKEKDGWVAEETENDQILWNECAHKEARFEFLLFNSAFSLYFMSLSCSLYSWVDWRTLSA